MANALFSETISADKSRSGPLLTIVVPVFNEEAVIEIFLGAIDAQSNRIKAALGPGSAIELLFVDDGSRDRTVETIIRFAKVRPDIVLVRLSRNFGKEAAMAAGLAYAKGDAVIPMDVDLQHPPEVIPDMIAAWRAGAKVVNAQHRSRSHEGWLRRNTSEVFYKLYNRMADYAIQQNVGDFRLLDRAVVKALNEMPERVRFMKGLFSWVGFTQANVQYERGERAAGHSKWVYWRLWNFALDGITGSTTLPLRIWTYVGAALAALTLVYAAYIVARTLMFGVDMPGYASLMVAILVIGAVNFISVGLLGEYVGRISVEVRQRPLYLVESTVSRETLSAQEESEPPLPFPRPAA